LGELGLECGVNAVGTAAEQPGERGGLYRELIAGDGVVAAVGERGAAFCRAPGTRWPFRFRVSVWSEIAPDFGTRIMSEDAVPERVVQLDFIWANRAGSRSCRVLRLTNEPASHRLVVTPFDARAW